MATYNGKSYDPDFICQDDYEWLTDTGPYAYDKAKARDFALKFCHNMNALIASGTYVWHTGVKDSEGSELQVTRFMYSGEEDTQFIQVFYTAQAHAEGYKSSFSKLGPQDFRIAYPDMHTPLKSCEMCHAQEAKYQIDHVVTPGLYDSVRTCAGCTDYFKAAIRPLALVLPLPDYSVWEDSDFYYYLSYQKQDKAPWRIVRVSRGQYATFWRMHTEAEALEWLKQLPSAHSSDHTHKGDKA